MRAVLGKYLRDTCGATSVEMAFLLTTLIALTGGAVEAGYVFYQYNGAQQAARMGARLAATSDPVARDLASMTGTSRNVQAGDPLPYYERHCSAATNRCDRGQFDQGAMDAIIFGPDRDLTCASAVRERRGMCDVFGEISRENVDVSYVSSGQGRAGFPADPAPLITVTVKNVPLNTVFLKAIAPSKFTFLPIVSVSLMGEDLRG